MSKTIRSRSRRVTRVRSRSRVWTHVHSDHSPDKHDGRLPQAGCGPWDDPNFARRKQGYCGEASFGLKPEEFLG